jgi:hypothetical protein
MFDDYPRLQTLVAVAGLQPDVRHRLLDGQRQQVAIEFGLPEQEIEGVMAIKAETLQDLVQGLLDWTTQQQSAA